VTNDTTPPADPPDVAEVRKRSLRCSSYSLFQDRGIMLFRYDEAVRERVVVAREARESLAHQAARIRELEAEVSRLAEALHLATSHSIDRFNRAHDAEVEVAALRAKVDRLRAERDKYLAQNTDLRKTWEEMRQERDTVLKHGTDVVAMERIAHAAGFHEALDAVSNALQYSGWVHWDKLRSHYPRPESIAEREVAAQMDAMHPEDIEYDVTLPRIPTGPQAEHPSKEGAR